MTSLLAAGTHMLVRSLMGWLTPPKKYATASGCEIPEPCWYPQESGDVCSRACPRSTATLRLRVLNAGATVRKIRFESESGVTLKPATLTLEPMQRGTVTATFTVDADADKGDGLRLLVWVRGCRTHYVCWRIVVAEHDSKPVELDVEDRPDYLHHWYDHFYCAHPCLGERR